MTLPARLAAFPGRCVRSLRARLDRWLVRRGARSRFWSALYYAWWSDAYAREQTANLAGRVAYARSFNRPAGSMALLRRNTHRLEKGLLMRPRRVPFALQYISETVDAYGAAARGGVDCAELEWAGDVLREYFRVHAGEVVVGPLQARFLASAGTDREAATPRRIPYRRDCSSPLRVDYDGLRQLAWHRRSVRWFQPRPVPRTDIDRALEIAALSPSACNRQPFEFRIFDDPALVRQVIEIPGGTAGYAHNVPAVAVIIGPQRHYFSERDRHLIYIDAALAAMSFLLALEVQGISSCCINWPDIAGPERRMAELLKLQPDERPVMLVAFGYPDPEGLVANSTKKSLQLLRRYNFE